MSKNNYDVLNLQNDNNNTGQYPLFLGDSLGFADEINVTYKEIDRVFKKQRSAFWVETEFSFEQDRLELMEAPDSEKDVMVLNLLAQWALDSMASRSIIEIFGPLVSNTEMHNWLLTQSFFESIHAATYSKIVRNCFSDSNAVLNRGKTNLEVFNRCKRIGEEMNKTVKMTGRYMSGEIPNASFTEYDMLKQIYISLAAVYALEQISFMSSFASTFALVETGKYAAIGKAVGAILADEQYHAEGDGIALGIMRRHYPNIADDTRDAVQGLVDDVTTQEFNWGGYIFSGGRKILGLNTPLLHEYSAFTAAPLYQDLGLTWDEKKFVPIPKTNPLPFMEVHGDRDMIQTANQEVENNNYRVGQVDDDIGDDQFDF